jgi:protein-serine/threonine kinase
MIITTPTSRMPSTKNATGDIHFHQKVKGWFTRSSSNRDRAVAESAAAATASSSHSSSHAAAASSSASRSDTKTPFRQTKFWTVGRLRSATTASEGNPLDESLSPTAHANPYFAHQGQPGLRHHNEGSVPPSPPDTPSVHVQAPEDDAPEQVAAATAARKEELARKLRRVASAPNAQGLFSKGAKPGTGPDSRPATAEMGKEPLEESSTDSGFADKPNGHPLDAPVFGFADKPSGLSPVAAAGEADSLGPMPPPSQSSLAFRRTYSSNSIKVRNVEVGPQSFDKIKLIGKGDVGKVYLVREKKSSRLYAMKGRFGKEKNPVVCELTC